MNKAFIESESLELKATFNEWREVIISLVAFANRRGGKVIVGVSDKGEIVSSTFGKNTIEDFVNKVKNHTDPTLYPSVTEKTFGPGQIVEILVTESDTKPVFAFNQAYIRVGKTNQKLSNSELRELIKRYTLTDFDNHVFPKKLSLADFDTILLKSFPGFNRLKLTNADYLCFIKVNSNFPNAIVKLGRFKGKTMADFIDSRNVDTNLINAVDENCNLLKRTLTFSMFFLVELNAKKFGITLLLPYAKRLLTL